MCNQKYHETFQKYSNIFKYYHGYRPHNLHTSSEGRMSLKDLSQKIEQLLAKIIASEKV